jgi:hypothetical protein
MNHAHIGNLVFERADDELVPDFRARVRSLVAELGGGVLAWGMPESLEWIEASPEVIDIAGGLKGCGANVLRSSQAGAGKLRWITQREPHSKSWEPCCPWRPVYRV